MAETTDHDDSKQTVDASLRWQNWPLRESMTRSVMAVVGLLLAALVVYVITGRIVLALLALLALLITSSRFYLPVEFELGGAGVQQRLLGRRRRIPWHAIGRYEIGFSGVLLLPNADVSPLDSLRGVYVAWSGNREAVLALVKSSTGDAKPKAD